MIVKLNLLRQSISRTGEPTPALPVHCHLALSPRVAEAICHCQCWIILGNLPLRQETSIRSFPTPPGAAYGVERYFSPNTISTRFLDCVRLLADYFWESPSMKKLATSIILPAVLSTALWAAPSFAGDMSAGSQGNGESPRGGATDQDYVYREAKPIAPKLEAGEESRAAPITDETAVINSLTAVGKSSDGKDLKVEPSDALKAIIKQAARRSGRWRRRRQDLGAEEGRRPGLQDRRRSLAPGVRQRRPHPDRQHQGLSVQRHRLSRIEGREGQLRKLLGDADRPDRRC